MPSQQGELAPIPAKFYLVRMAADRWVDEGYTLSSEKRMVELSDDARRKRLYFRCHHMGTAENDLLFGRFAERCLDRLDLDGLGGLESLLAHGDNDLYNWVTGAETPPPHIDANLLRLIKNANKKI